MKLSTFNVVAPAEALVEVRAVVGSTASLGLNPVMGKEQGWALEVLCFLEALLSQ